MNALKMGLTVLAGTALGSSMAVPAFASDQPAAEPSSSDIIVTARRVEERLQDVPISISVLNQEQLANRNITTAGDLGTYIPSLATNANFGPESTSFAIRGFTKELGTAPSVAVYFADAPVPRVQGGTEAGNGAGVGALFDLQNIQVLKGPQGTLFGINTTGGAVLLVPQKPSHKFEGYVEGSLGDYNMRRLQAVINVPISDSVRVRLGVDHQARDGYLKNISGIGPNNFNDVNYTAARASVVIDLTPNLENYTVANYSISTTNGYVPKLVICNPAGGFASFACPQVARDSKNYYDVENADPHAGQRIRQIQAVNTTSWTASDTLSAKNIFSYGRFTQDQSFTVFGDNFSLGPGIPLTFVNFDTVPGHHNASEESFSDEVQIHGHSTDGKIDWQAGGYVGISNPIGFQGTYSSILMSCSNVLTFQCFGPFPGVSHIDIQLSQYRFRDEGAYAQSTYKFTDQLSLTGGIRYTWNKSDAIGEVRTLTFTAPNTPVYTCNPGGQPAPTAATCFQEVKTQSSRPTWLIDLDYKPTRDMLFYAKWARGYREGGANTSQPGFAPWGPEKVDSYEAGSKTSFASAVKGSLDIAAFYDRFSNQQLQANSTNPQNPASPIVNAGKSRIFGVEVDASVRPVDSVSLQVAYSYLNTKLISLDLPPNLNASAVVGGPLTLSPRNRVSLTGTYQFPIDPKLGKLSVAGTFTHTDSQVSTNASPVGLINATNLLNLNLNWDSVAGSSVDLSVFATNVTNVKYYTYASGSYPSVGYDSVSIAAPRMVGGRMRVRF